MSMSLSEELTWRGFVNQTTYKDIDVLNGSPISFYWGVDPSADSMTIGNLATAMMVRHFIDHGHKAFLLVGGATGLIGDPDGKSTERELKSVDEVAANKAKLAEEYRRVFAGQAFEQVDNYDWFKDMGYLEFLRDVGKHVPLRQMVGREFVQNRLGETGAGISYAEFSYVLIQAYDFLHLHRAHGVDLQVCGADQWGNSIAGVDLIRRETGDEAHVWSAPLVVNKTTGVKFGKSEEGAVWLDAAKTSVYKFYQFWLNVDDEGVEDYLKIYTLLPQVAIAQAMTEFNQNRGGRAAQKHLAYEVTKLIHGEAQADKQVRIAEAIIKQTLDDLSEAELTTLREELTVVKLDDIGRELAAILVAGGLAASKSEARQLIASGAVYVNGVSTKEPELQDDLLQNGHLLLRRGKAFKDTALVEKG
jgi:tyrosyl-tRNA synthetase